MKFIYLCLIVIPFFISCSESTDAIASDTKARVSKSSNRLIADSGSIVSPENDLNPYDIAGQLHAELYAVYYAEDSLSSSVASIADRVTMLANENESFTALAGIDYSFLSTDRVTYILSTIDSCTPEIIDASLVAPEAKNSFTTFVNSLFVLCETESNYAVIHDFVVTYENEISENSSFSLSDKEVILTTTSIARYAVYERKKRPKKNTDPEWDLLVANIAGGTEGSAESLEKAIVMSLITSIAENE
ncbi:hypothetical protein FLSI110296_10585 [Flavobacterium sinopsychrotolerans]|uniref:Lipoprotein n=1 Tax=Flavobacterium sinopsychrotolerans TaxID=604089 RepID=A0A1H8LZ83_9FLAO|nr:hypothetical protein [Flavobacterium sinopsychrotolerans]SEO10186.1 hypothetical protein SAMN04487942_1740 [Flavobacterium sinopsychrotolerans]